MNSDELNLRQARMRLASNKANRFRPGSVAGTVANLLPEIHDALRRKKPWKQIACDIAGDGSLKTDTVRQAYHRLQRDPEHGSGSMTKTLSPETTAEVPTLPAKAPVTEVTRQADSLLDTGLFAPIFDVKYTREHDGGEDEA